MDLLESAMAFAVAMILFSTVATGIVELAFRVFAMREDALKKTVESLFDAVIWPRLKAHLVDPGANEAAQKANLRLCFLRDMTGNPAVAGVFNGDNAEIGVPLARTKRIDMLTTLAFAERLGKSEIGRAILAEGADQLEPLVKDFARTYDRFGRASREVYRKNAQMAAILVGVGLAFVANIDAGRLLNTLVENPDLRTRLIADAETAARANRDAAESLAAVQKLADEGKLPEGQAATIKAQTAALIDRITATERTGLPVGWSYFPYCRAVAAGAAGTAEAAVKAAPLDPACAGSAGFWARIGNNGVAFAHWVVLTALAGFLIGLGGPFWFRVFSGLSQIAQMLRSIGIGGKKAEPEGTTADPQTPPDDPAKPKDVIDAFVVAAKVAHGGAAGAGAR